MCSPTLTRACSSSRPAISTSPPASPFSQLESLKANPDVIFLRGAVARIDYIGDQLLTRARSTDVKVRQAINYAINKDAIIQNVLFGAGQLANTYLPLMYGHDPRFPAIPTTWTRRKALIARDRRRQRVRRRSCSSSPAIRSVSQVAQLVAADLAADRRRRSPSRSSSRASIASACEASKISICRWGTTRPTSSTRTN